MSKKKTTRSSPKVSKPRARKKPAARPDPMLIEVDAVEPTPVITDEEIDVSQTLGVVESASDEKPSERSRASRGGRGRGGRKPAVQPPKAEPSDPGKATVERESNQVVIRFAPVKLPTPSATAATVVPAPTKVNAPTPPTIERIDTRDTEPPPHAREARSGEPPRPGDRRENHARQDPRRREIHRDDRDRPRPDRPFPADDRGGDNREEGRGGRRRRRRRRGRGGNGEGREDQRGNSRNQQRGGEGSVAPPSRGVAYTDIANDQELNVQPQPRPRNAEGGEPTADGQRPLTPSQKRRLRRRRRSEQHRGGEVPGEDGGVAIPEESALPAEPTVLRPPPVNIGGEEDDEHEMEDRLEARELLESDETGTETGEPTAEIDVEDAGVEDAQRRERGRRGRGRDRGRGRRRREWGDSSEADSRVFGEDGEGSAAIEIEPEAAPLGLDALASGEEAPPQSGAKRREMIVNIVPHEECRIAILEDGKLEQIYLERASSENHVGNIYKGIVTNVEASIQAAFIDFGLGKNGFLHISDLHPKFFPGSNDERTENVGRKMPRKARPPIQRCLRRGQELLVQITKEGIGTKGPTLTTYLSVPGRFLVMMPGMRQLGVSRKIEDEDLRRKLRAQMNDLELPDDIGFIARTAAEDRTKKELQADLNYLTRLWRAVEKRIENERAPAELYRDSDLVIRTIRDVFASDITRIVIDDASVAERAGEFLGIFSPKARDIVQTYTDAQPIFHRYGVEHELERLHSRHVPLRSGGSLVIDQTEALVAIDVNSGKFRTEDDAETTAYKINIEAADEIPRQLRLRDLGGVIICDFIDMRFEQHRREIERRLIANLKQHKERAKVLRMSQFGIIEMTRQRQRASLTRSVYQDCHHCRGSGLVKTSESVALDVMRLLQLAVTRENIRSIEVSVSPEVAYLLQNRKRSQIHEMEQQYQRAIGIRPDALYSLDQVQIHCADHRGRVVPHP